MKKGVPAKRHRINICKHCNSEFNCFDKKASTCPDCSSIITFECACGCGTIVSRTKFKSFKNKYEINHDKRGKTYKEIYGTSTPTCGFKTGLLNPNYIKDKYKRFKYKNSIGQKFSSKLEVQFSEFLIKNNITYTTEVKVPLNNNKVKIVDFVLNDFIYVEITGFAYEAWQQDFIKKMQVLRLSIQNPILILTYTNNINDVQLREKLNKCMNLDVFIDSIDNEQGILKKIQLFESMEIINSFLKLKLN